MTDTFKLAVVSAGTSDPSSTRLLADRIADRTVALAARHGHEVTVTVIELRELAADITSAVVSQLVSPRLRQAIDALGVADGLVVSTPSTRPGPAACSSRSSTCWTTTC